MEVTPFPMSQFPRLKHIFLVSCYRDEITLNRISVFIFCQSQFQASTSMKSLNRLNKPLRQEVVLSPSTLEGNEKQTDK